MATSKVNTSLMKNSPSTSKTTANKSTASKAKTSTAKKGTTGKAAAKTSTAQKSKRTYTRNGAAATLFGSGIAAFGGAAVITGFDLLVNQYAPSVSMGIRTTVKFGVGLGMKFWGKKLPVIGGYSDPIANAFLLAGALDVLGNTVVPYVVNWLSPTPEPIPIKDTATGQLGYQYAIPGGGQMQIFDDSNGGDYAAAYGGGYQGANYYGQN